jgi:hypothetical protein
LVEQLGLSIKLKLVKDEELGGDKPYRETGHQRAEWEWPWTLVCSHD